ncbi:MAG: phospholipase D-like domain-containing protein [Acidimicrobiales bacterium]
MSTVMRKWVGASVAGAGAATAYGLARARYDRTTAPMGGLDRLPPTDSEEFAHLLDAATGSPVRQGNRVRVLRNGDETFPAMLEAIAAAKESVDFSSYIYWPGEITDRFTDAFVERARAGVEVRVIVDAYGSARLGRDHVRRLEEAGVRFRFFRAPAWHNLLRTNNRMHRRLLIVDGEVGFAGGVGVADVWTGHAQDPEHWRETHVRLEGPVVRDVLGGFLESWTESAREIPVGDRSRSLAPFDDGVPVQATRSSPGGGEAEVALLFLLAIAGATKRIWMTTAYFTAGRRFLDALAAAARRGVDVEILANGRAVDKQVLRRTGQHCYGELLKAGVRIHEYDRTMLHAKTLVVDDAWADIGSSNFDNRSFALDAELNLAFYDRGVATQLADHFLEDLEQSHEIDFDAWRSRQVSRFRTLI